MATFVYIFLSVDQAPYRSAHGTMIITAKNKYGAQARVGVGALMSGGKRALDDCGLEMLEDYAFSNKGTDSAIAMHFTNDNAFFIAKLRLQGG